MTWYVVTYPHIAGWAIYRHINLFFFDLQYTGILHRYPQSLRYVTIRDRYHRRYAYRPSYIWGGISRRHRYALSMWYICGNILLRIFRHISVYITYTVAYFDILFEFRMFSEYHFSDMEIYHITNFTRITRILLSILLILLISSFRGKSSTRLGGNRSVIRRKRRASTRRRRAEAAGDVPATYTLWWVRWRVASASSEVPLRTSEVRRCNGSVVV